MQAKGKYKCKYRKRKILCLIIRAENEDELILNITPFNNNANSIIHHLLIIH